MPLTAEDQAKYRSLYFTTAKPYVQALHDAVVHFSQENVDEEQLAIAHRSAHSLTSQSKMMGFEHIAGMASVLEHIFQAKVEKRVEFGIELLEKIKVSVALLNDVVNKLEAEGTEIDITQQKDELLALSGIALPV